MSNPLLCFRSSEQYESDEVYLFVPRNFITEYISPEVIQSDNAFADIVNKAQEIDISLPFFVYDSTTSFLKAIIFNIGPINAFFYTNAALCITFLDNNTNLKDILRMPLKGKEILLPENFSFFESFLSINLVRNYSEIDIKNFLLKLTQMRLIYPDGGFVSINFSSLINLLT